MLGEASKAHFETLCALLDAAGIAYVINPKLVRGLDYYNHTVFEWVTDGLGAQGTVLAGGRYDGLVEQLGGKPTPAVGFALGMERLVLLLENLPFAEKTEQHADLYMVAMDQAALQVSLQIATEIRKAMPRVRVMQHCGGGAMKKQMKRADKSQAAYALIVGEQEVADETVMVKPLRVSGAQATIKQTEIVPYLAELPWQQFSKGVS